MHISYIGLGQKVFVSDSLIFKIDISVAQLEYSDQVPRASHSRWSAPHQKLSTQDGQSYQQGTSYDILAR